jgi:Ran GTPase-activating protein (RanGAP) involved in mRNA processing and transport
LKRKNLNSPLLPYPFLISSWGHLTRLTQLNLSHNPSKKCFGIADLTPLLPHNLKTLNLSHTKLFYKPYVAKMLKRFTALENLNLSSNAPVHHPGSTLQLSMAKKELYNNTIDILTYSFTHFSSLKHLKLQSNFIDPFGLKLLLNLPFSLLSLDLSYNPFYYNTETIHVRFPYLSSLRSLNLEATGLNNKSLKILLSILPKTLTELNLSYNKFNLKKIFKYKEIFKNLTSLKFLILNIPFFNFLKYTRKKLFLQNFLLFLENFSLTIVMHASNGTAVYTDKIKIG